MVVCSDGEMVGVVVGVLYGKVGNKEGRACIYFANGKRSKVAA
jgi:antitoxin component YwqK of YwqJK toxin-antitoxin module